MRSLGWRGLIGGLSVAAVVALAASDGPPASLSGFWSQHAMLTNLVSSAGFAVLTVTVIEAWVHRQQERRTAAPAIRDDPAVLTSSRRVDDRYEIGGGQAGAADQGAVHVRDGH